MRRRCRVDTNQSEIVAALRGIGATVAPTHMVGHGFPDIVVGFRGANFLFEIKSGDRWKLTSDEWDWHQEWSGSVDVVTSPDQAIELVTGGTGGIGGGS